MLESSWYVSARTRLRANKLVVVDVNVDVDADGDVDGALKEEEEETKRFVEMEDVMDIDGRKHRAENT